MTHCDSEHISLASCSFRDKLTSDTNGFVSYHQDLAQEVRGRKHKVPEHQPFFFEAKPPFWTCAPNGRLCSHVCIFIQHAPGRPSCSAGSVQCPLRKPPDNSSLHGANDRLAASFIGDEIDSQFSQSQQAGKTCLGNQDSEGRCSVSYQPRLETMSTLSVLPGI